MMQPVKRRAEGVGELAVAVFCPSFPHPCPFPVALSIPNANPNLDWPAMTPATGRTSRANPSNGRRRRGTAMTVFTMRATSGTGRDWAINARVASNAVP